MPSWGYTREVCDDEVWAVARVVELRQEPLDICLQSGVVGLDDIRRLYQPAARSGEVADPERSRFRVGHGEGLVGETQHQLACLLVCLYSIHHYGVGDIRLYVAEVVVPEQAVEPNVE